MGINNNLEKQVDKYLEQQAKMDTKGRKIIDLFNEEYSKQDVESLVDYLLKNSASTYDSDLKAFIEHYESKDKNKFTVKDIKIYLTLNKVHKKHMKEPKPEENDNCLSQDKTDEHSDNAEGSHE